MKRAVFLILSAFSLAYLVIFPLLVLDTAARLLGQRAAFETGNLVFVLYLEISRAFTTLIAIVVVLVLLVRASRTPDGRALALFLIFLALSYEKAFGVSYPGSVQVSVTQTLIGAGVSRALLFWLFGSVPWTIWPALAALLRFSVTFPPPGVSATAIDVSGEHDRRGTLRGNAVAGADVGAWFRALSKRALAANAFAPVPVWSSAVVLVAATGALSGIVRILIIAAGLALIVPLAVTNLRAAYNAGGLADRQRMDWLTLAFAAGTAIFVTAAVPLLFFDATLAVIPAVVLLMLAPAVTMVLLAGAVLYHGTRDAGRLVSVVPYLAARTLGMLFVFAVLMTAFTMLFEPDGTWRALAVGGAATGTALCASPLRRLTDRGVNRILERALS